MHGRQCHGAAVTKDRWLGLKTTGIEPLPALEARSPEPGRQQDWSLLEAESDNLSHVSFPAPAGGCRSHALVGTSLQSLPVSAHGLLSHCHVSKCPVF